MTIANRLIEPTLLFDFSISLKSVVRNGAAGKNRTSPKRKIAGLSSERVHGPSDWDLDQSHKLPNFAALAGYTDRATVWAGWAMDGMYFKMKTFGKSSPPRFFGHSGGVSDGLRVWIDTRSSPGIHRATRFCHCFHFFPGQSAGMKALASKEFRGSDEASGVLDSIPRFREAPNAIDANEILVSSHTENDGYTLWSHVPANCLTGYAPDQFDAISLFVEVVDFELGTQSISLGPELRYVEDPSLWIRAELTQ